MVNHGVPITTGELAPLWSGFLGDSMAKAVLNHFQATVQDTEIRSIIAFALSLTEEHLSFKIKLFAEEGVPKPEAFSSEDVDLGAPPLFTDTLVLHYLRQMGISGVAAYGLAVGSSFRSDIREFFNHNLKTATELLNRATTLLLERGQLFKTPVIPFPEHSELVQKEGWLNGWFGDRRPLNAVEIAHVHLNIITNSLGKALMSGFAQACRTKDVMEFVLRGKALAERHIVTLRTYLEKDGLPSPANLDAEVTASTRPPFSEKLMLFHTVFLTAIGIGGLGNALAGSVRRDLAAEYVQLMAQVGTYGDDGTELLIRYGWMEKIPGAVERDALLPS
ncbi:DUF3231 family protein [Gorillibacterium sp. sgz5001074]|uniref:DUF3231 family protein n=1 Tax=Gorillibacterium sp. sgz5001074 TaxID=3446695 RepID=UPI003F67B601